MTVSLHGPTAEVHDVITKRQGAFAETVEHGRAGFRCRTMAEFCDAIVGAVELDRKYIRERAIRLYSYDAVIPQYRDYFDFVYAVDRDSYYAEEALRWRRHSAVSA